MRVIAGTVKGFTLQGPPSRATRPMSGKIRQALFSSLASLGIDPVRVLDLYAGTGSIGIEALSRGADWCDFVDHSAAACAVIRKNLDHTRFSGSSQVHQIAVPSFLSRQTGSWDLVIIDPPYADPAILATLQHFADSPLLESDGVVVIGHSPRVDLPDLIGQLVRIKNRCHGDSCFSIYERQQSSPPSPAVLEES